MRRFSFDGRHGPRGTILISGIDWLSAEFRSDGGNAGWWVMSGRHGAPGEFGLSGPYDDEDTAIGAMHNIGREIWEPGGEEIRPCSR